MIGSHIAERDTSLVKSFAVCIVAPLQLCHAFISRPLKRVVCQLGAGAKDLQTEVRHFGRKNRKDGIRCDVHGQRDRAVAGTTIPHGVSPKCG